MKKKHPEHVNLERWLVSYADFITLLFAFFVVMYSIANQDKAKIKQITEAIERTFRGPSTMLDLGSGSQVNVMSNPSSDYGQILTTDIGRTNARPDMSPELSEIAQKIEESLSYQLQTTDLKDVIRIIHDDRGLVIRFSANKLFRPGQDSVEKPYLPLLDKIGKIIAPGERVIRVEGHTDDSPLPKEGKFDTNWELSSARAIWIVRYLRARFEIPTARLSAAGFADGQPVAKNDSEEGKSMNRRVEIVITNLKVAPKK
ncbi:MAG TPA: flagellar motor protein MotB [Bdellovibrionota bacterium]|jgi:chemotaxis protein MotB